MKPKLEYRRNGDGCHINKEIVGFSICHNQVIYQQHQTQTVKKNKKYNKKTHIERSTI